MSADTTTTSIRILSNSPLISHINFFFLPMALRTGGFAITLIEHTTLDRTPLDEWSNRRRDLYLTTYNTHKSQTSMFPAGFEPIIPSSKRPKIGALRRADTGIGIIRRREVTHTDSVVKCTDKSRCDAKAQGKRLMFQFILACFKCSHTIRSFTSSCNWRHVLHPRYLKLDT
jgi:hypothetical protein